MSHRGSAGVIVEHPVSGSRTRGLTVESLTKANILIVDDRPDKRLALSALLSDLGENVVLADSGREALRQVLHADFAVILLDINMPDVDGFETAMLIRTRGGARRTPIIFLTAYADDLYESRCYELGAVDFMLTPVSPEILKAKVAVFVDLFRKGEQVRLLAESLREANRLKDELLATLSYQLRAPLNAILGWTHILQAAPDDPEKMARGLGSIARHVGAEVRLIEDLVDVSRSTADELTRAAQPRPCDGVASDPKPRVPAPIVETAAPASLAAEPGLAGLRVLVVEDDADGREILREVLVGHHAEVTLAGSAREALQALEAGRPDVLVSDVMMPGEDGYELMRLVRRRAAEDGGDVPALALTACARAQDRARALDVGFQMHAAKPIHPNALVAAIVALAREKPPRRPVS
jgi:CheY-like chemotaxis protein